MIGGRAFFRARAREEVLYPGAAPPLRRPFFRSGQDPHPDRT
jgi:hypothetical protein